MGIIKEFKEFAVKGNMMDMAIGIIIGAAFSSIVKSLVADIAMPLFGLATDGVSLADKSYELRAAEKTADGTIINEALILKYGQFLNTTIDFFIIAICVFIVIKLINKLKRKGEDPSEKSTPTPKDIQLLTEIRDALTQPNEQR